RIHPLPPHRPWLIARDRNADHDRHPTRLYQRFYPGYSTQPMHRNRPTPQRPDKLPPSRLKETTNNQKLTTINYQLTTINYQLSTNHHEPSRPKNQPTIPRRRRAQRPCEAGERQRYRTFLCAGVSAWPILRHVG